MRPSAYLAAIDDRTYIEMADQAKAAGKIVIPLLATGTGEGVLTLRIYSTANTLAYITGTGQFYSDAGGTTGASPVTSLTANAWKTFYVKVPSGTAYIVINNVAALTKWGASGYEFITEVVNAPKLNGFNIEYLDATSVTSIRIYANLGYSSVSGSIAGLTLLTYLHLAGSAITVSGSIAGLTLLTYLHLAGSAITVSGSIAGLTLLTILILSGGAITVSGSIAGLTLLTSLYLYGSAITVSGSIAGLTLLTYLYLDGSAITVSGSIAGLTLLTTLALSGGAITVSGSIAGLTLLAYLRLGGSAITITYNEASGRSWPSALSRIYVDVYSFTSAMVDSMLIDVDNSISGVVTTQPIYLAGNCAAHTSASDAAIASLQAKGNTVTVKS